MIIINFKNYVHGKKSLDLAKKIEKFLPHAIVAVSAVDIAEIARKTKLRVYAQHVDSVSSPKRSTGYVTAEGVKKAGAVGSLVNHSEHQLDDASSVWNVLSDLEEYRLERVVCVPTLKVAKEFKRLKPSAMAFEDVELIATGKSITNYRTKEIEGFVGMLRGSKIIPLCGAGISSAADVERAYELGCKGVIIASAIANTKNPEKLLREMFRVLQDLKS